jgi:hypothetical protein
MLITVCLVIFTSLRVIAADRSDGLTLLEGVETLFAPNDQTALRWYARLIIVPDAEAESELLLACSTDKVCYVEKVSVSTGVYTLVRKVGSTWMINGRELMSKKDVSRSRHTIDPEQANRWLQRLFVAVGQTPTDLLRRSLVARSSPPATVLLHPTTYVLIFDDYRLQFRVAVLGPVLTAASLSDVPLVSAMAGIIRGADVSHERK